MKRPLAALFVLVLVLVLGILWVQRPRDEPSPPVDAGLVKSQASPPAATGVSVTEITTPNAPGGSAETKLLGETILADYARADLPPEQDLTLMSRLMENSLLLLKSAANRPLSSNEDWADLLRGHNGARERFLPEQHIALNAQGQLIDRWGTPLFFHALGGARYELRSAGPDQQLWTKDDIHRNADGSFRSAADLDAPSLLETAIREQPRSTAP